MQEENANSKESQFEIERVNALERGNGLYLKRDAITCPLGIAMILYEINYCFKSYVLYIINLSISAI